MRCGAIDFPEDLLSALRDDRLVVFAGAGLSMGEPANFPSFRGLAEQIAQETGYSATEPYDRFLGQLHRRGMNVYVRAAEVLSRAGALPTPLHSDLLRLFRNASRVRVITTNFDVLFEQAAQTTFGEIPEVFGAPALPLGRSFQGIIHLHGTVTKPQDIVLTDADFGRAYLTEGWARRFLVDVFRHYTVLFVGYSHDDTVMHYLARALPQSDVAPRFALSDGPGDWDALNIKTILYPNPSGHDHRLLNEGVRRLSEEVSRGNEDWRHVLTELAGGVPPLDPEAVGRIENGLKDVATTRFFTNAAKGPEWISWFDERHYFDSLFREGELSERDRVLAWWLGEHYAVRRADTVLSMISRHQMRLNSAFWWVLGRQIGLDNQSPLDESVLSRWITVLLATAPAKPDDAVLDWLSARCATVGALPALTQIFIFMTGWRLNLKPGLPWPEGDPPNAQPRLEVQLVPVVRHHAFHHTWETRLRTRISDVAEPVLAALVNRMEETYLILRLWQKSSRDLDSMSYRRSAIEPHEQDRYPDALDVVINAARDCLEWLASNQDQLAGSWCERLIRADAPLLRRLAVHALGARLTISSDEHLSWLLDHTGLHDRAAHHEIFRLARLAYPRASPDTRARVINAVQAYRWPDESDPQRDEWAARRQFDWLYWLHAADPACPLAEAALGEITAQHPEFHPRDHSDFTHWLSPAEWVGPQSPWSVEALLSRPATEWLPELLAFRGEGFFGPDRSGLVQMVREAATRQFEWGNALAGALAESGNWASDLWGGLIRSWSEWPDDEANCQQALVWLDREELYAEHANAIAEALHALVRHDGRPCAVPLLSQANTVGKKLWQHLERNPQAIEEPDDWLSLAINRPAGVLAEFWLGSLSLWRGGLGDSPATLPPEYQEILTTIVDNAASAGALGRTVIASQFVFLFSLDEVWTRRHVLPLFSPDAGSARFRQAWDGFLTWGRLTPSTAEALSTAFLQAVAHIRTDLKHCQDRFIEFFTHFLVFYADDPLNVGIPDFFRHSEVEDRSHFASNMEYLLRNIDDTPQREWWQRWLRRYWENGLNGIPAPLERNEIAGMFDWVPHFKSVFPEAVGLAIQIPRTPLENSHLICELEESEALTQHPNEVARLLVYFTHMGSPPSFWGGLRDVIPRIAWAHVEPPLKGRVRERLAAIGFDGPLESSGESTPSPPP